MQLITLRRTLIPRNTLAAAGDLRLALTVQLQGFIPNENSPHHLFHREGCWRDQPIDTNYAHLFSHSVGYLEAGVKGKGAANSLHDFSWALLSVTKY